MPNDNCIRCFGYDKDSDFCKCCAYENEGDCKNPNGTEVKPVYSEDRLTTSPFKL